MIEHISEKLYPYGRKNGPYASYSDYETLVMMYSEMKKTHVTWIETSQQRPEDEQMIVYYFEPFDKVYFGQYDKESDSVMGRSGFTTMVPEVPFWMPIPELPN